jgi:hypothetical protein
MMQVREKNKKTQSYEIKDLSKEEMDQKISELMNEEFLAFSYDLNASSESLLPNPRKKK